jgi:hypothetical protein
MVMARNPQPPATQSDIVESELLDILQTVIDAHCGLSAIHQILDEAKTMSDIRARFSQWQADQHARKAGGTPDEAVNGSGKTRQ